MPKTVPGIIAAISLLLSILSVIVFSACAMTGETLFFVSFYILLFGTPILSITNIVFGGIGIIMETGVKKRIPIITAILGIPVIPLYVYFLVSYSFAP
ncbi:hypothetical protein [Falsibacillus albus]|uniref:Uncharacterized protein n=1 Tax=Falsibacillus albus TaxID=2478915 RepID=A0A3L7JV55_9BACI|nr:hypothetical protein [Falsibacillus albus]RLQ92302.1 hypothetical protein D9X91_19700 [Falsibacillus albus]